MSDDMTIRIVKSEGLMVDQETFQPYMRVTFDVNIELMRQLPEEDQAFVFYQAFLKAWEKHTNE